MKTSERWITLILFLLIICPAIGWAQNLGNSVLLRPSRHFLFWEIHHSVISQDGTFVKLFPSKPSNSTGGTSADALSATWKFQIVPLSGQEHELTLPSYPSLFAFGESNKLFVTIPDPAAWKNLEPGKLPANATTKLYIISAPYDDAALQAAVTVDIKGFVGSLRVRDINGAVYGYLTARNLAEDPSVQTEETTLDRWLVVVDVAGHATYTELK